MVSVIRVCGVLCSVAFGLIGVIGRGAEPPESAEGLVQQALVAELGSDMAQRRKLLDQAIAISPDYAPARWHAGMVRVNDAWLSVGDVESRTATHGLVFEYRQLRDRYADTVAGQEALARWCRKKHWDELEKLHWTNVLRINPSHREARSRLEVREYGGMLLTKEQVDRHETWQKAHDQALDHWRPRLRKLKRNVEGADDAAREAALVELWAIDEQAAIPAVEEILSTSGELLGLAAVDIVASIKGYKPLSNSLTLSRHLATQEFSTATRQCKTDRRARTRSNAATVFS
ncbi:MAG: hypothetical protein HYV60_02355 [Planctomycetia bacterium]|nr:hypothetical protein [Planctomycetia bacterium]